MRLVNADEIRKKAVPHTRGNFGYSADIRKWAVLVGDIDDTPTIDPIKHGYVPIEVLKQIQWERDIAMSYLEEAGIGFGEKAELQRVKHGKWEEMRNAYGELEGWIHTECGREVKCMENFCPHCGARMDGD